MSKLTVFLVGGSSAGIIEGIAALPVDEIIKLVIQIIIAIVTLIKLLKPNKKK
ncbi:MAG: hypothetical protein GYA62_15305 [Bacteroidales bacterium]|nr:hypothetical protein [Bacteroidales bacterium]